MAARREPVIICTLSDPVARYRKLLRKDALLVFLVLLVAGLLVERFGGDATLLRWLGAPPPMLQAEYAPAAAADGLSAEVAHTAPLQQQVDIAAIPAAGKPVRFFMQNVQNYFVEGETQRSRYVLKPKSRESRDAVVELIAHAAPQIVGLIEVGGPVALQDLRQRLAARGLEYPYFRVLPRQGEDRALALLSVHPIVQDHSQEQVKLHQQKRRKMLRGILDVTVRLNDGRLFRIIGAHLKSRVADNAGAASALRKQEAYTLAQHIRHIASTQKGLPLLVFGDWNDGPADAAPQILMQGLSADAALRRLSPRDSRGEEWTFYFKRGKEYCIYDQIFVNSALRARMRGQGGIIDIPASAKASDHRALWCDLR